MRLPEDNIALMDLLQIVALSALQGLTEFLPISSSGHLIIFPWLLGWETPGLSFDAALHLGTLAAVAMAASAAWPASLSGWF